MSLFSPREQMFLFSPSHAITPENYLFTVLQKESKRLSPEPFAALGQGICVSSMQCPSLLKQVK